MWPYADRLLLTGGRGKRRFVTAFWDVWLRPIRKFAGLLGTELAKRRG